MAAKRLAKKKQLFQIKKKRENERDEIRTRKTENLSLDKYVTKRNTHN
jgi:hypothetical protein